MRRRRRLNPKSKIQNPKSRARGDSSGPGCRRGQPSSPARPHARAAHAPVEDRRTADRSGAGLPPPLASIRSGGTGDLRPSRSRRRCRGAARAATRSPRRHVDLLREVAVERHARPAPCRKHDEVAATAESREVAGPCAGSARRRRLRSPPAGAMTPRTGYRRGPGRGPGRTPGAPVQGETRGPKTADGLDELATDREAARASAAGEPADRRPPRPGAAHRARVRARPGTASRLPRSEPWGVSLPPAGPSRDSGSRGQLRGRARRRETRCGSTRSPSPRARGRAQLRGGPRLQIGRAATGARGDEVRLGVQRRRRPPQRSRPSDRRHRDPERSDTASAAASPGGQRSPGELAAPARALSGPHRRLAGGVGMELGIPWAWSQPDVAGKTATRPSSRRSAESPRRLGTKARETAKPDDDGPSSGDAAEPQETASARHWGCSARQIARRPFSALGRQLDGAALRRVVRETSDRMVRPGREGEDREAPLRSSRTGPPRAAPRVRGSLIPCRRRKATSARERRERSRGKPRRRTPRREPRATASRRRRGRARRPRVRSQERRGLRGARRRTASSEERAGRRPARTSGSPMASATREGAMRRLRRRHGPRERCTDARPSREGDGQDQTNADATPSPRRARDEVRCSSDRSCTRRSERPRPPGGPAVATRRRPDPRPRPAGWRPNRRTALRTRGAGPRRGAALQGRARLIEEPPSDLRSGAAGRAERSADRRGGGHRRSRARRRSAGEARRRRPAETDQDGEAEPGDRCSSNPRLEPGEREPGRAQPASRPSGGALLRCRGARLRSRLCCRGARLRSRDPLPGARLGSRDPAAAARSGSRGVADRMEQPAQRDGRCHRAESRGRWDPLRRPRAGPSSFQ